MIGERSRGPYMPRPQRVPRADIVLTGEGSIIGNRSFAQSIGSSEELEIRKTVARELAVEDVQGLSFTEEYPIDKRFVIPGRKVGRTDIGIEEQFKGKTLKELKEAKAKVGDQMNKLLDIYSSRVEERLERLRKEGKLKR